MLLGFCFQKEPLMPILLFFLFFNNLLGLVLKPIVWISKSSSFDYFYKEFGVGST
jgi:hypothetical protein